MKKVCFRFLAVAAAFICVLTYGCRPQPEGAKGRSPEKGGEALFSVQRHIPQTLDELNGLYREVGTIRSVDLDTGEDRLIVGELHRQVSVMLRADPLGEWIVYPPLSVDGIPRVSGYRVIDADGNQLETYLVEPQVRDSVEAISHGRFVRTLFVRTEDELRIEGEVHQPGKADPVRFADCPFPQDLSPGNHLISPDGRYMVVKNNREARLDGYDLQTGEYWEITDIPGEFGLLSFSWQPDRINFRHASGDRSSMGFYSCPLEGGEWSPSEFGYLNAPGRKWKAVFKFVDFSSQKAYDRPLLEPYVENYENLQRYPLEAPNPLVWEDINWSPDGSALVYQSVAQPSPGASPLTWLVVKRMPGAEEFKPPFSFDEMGRMHGRMFSPEGGFFAYLANFAEEKRRHFIVNLENGDAFLAFEEPGKGRPSPLFFSPDGAWAAAQIGQELLAIRTSGGEAVTLTDSGFTLLETPEGTGPRGEMTKKTYKRILGFSPDSTRLLYWEEVPEVKPFIMEEQVE